MPGLYLYSSNRLEVLAGGLAQILEHPLTSPLAAEIIIVQSRGMERWLTLQLTDHLGALANCRFPFPNAFLQELFAAVLSDTEDEVFLKEHMTFRLMGLLGHQCTCPGFSTIARYLEDDPAGLKCYALARNLADSFDQYLIFRPRLIHAWDNERAMYAGDHSAAALEAWQAQLWRALNTPPRPHRASLSRALLAALNRAELPGLPERIAIFGISYLPPLFIEIFETLAHRIDVHLFLMNPCREYWSHIQGLRVQERLAERSQASGDDLHLEEGNALLAGLGAQGKYFIDRVCASDDVRTIDDYRAPEAITMLAQVQNDILSLTQPEAKRPVLPDDTSIQVHACHSPMREVEVLHDHLLDLFQHHPGLTPEDILVMAPNIEVYAPFIEAVFGYAGNERMRIPYSIADKPGGRQPVIEVMLALLEIADGRLPADAVMSLLETPAVRGRFGILDDRLPLVRDWIDKTRIRWAYDGRHKTALGLPPEHANTWRFGLDRMLLGYALPGETTQPWRQILPYTEIEGENAELLGRLAELIDRLHAWIEACTMPQPPAAWAALLTKGLDAFCDPDLTQGRLELRTALDRLSAAPFTGSVSLNVMKAWLGDHFRSPSEHGFLAGGVTCCSLLPMRSIPFKVICLLGLDNDTFPRQQTRKGFDLMTLKPQRGDRSRRDDDRYLFLEALVSARETLYLSYVGQHQQDNSSRPPSVLISELLDYLEKAFTFSSFAVTRVHRLHGFAPAYFTGDPQLFSYARMQAETARILRTRILPETRRFITAALPEPGPQWRMLDGETLVRFFQHPVGFFLEQRLGMRLPRGEPELDNREPFMLEGLNRYLTGAYIIDARRRGEDPADQVFALGILPHGNAGIAAYRRQVAELEPLAEKITAYTRGTLEACPIDLTIGEFRITGGIPVYAAGNILYRSGKLRAKDLLALWIRHVLLNAQGPTVSRALGCEYLKGRAVIREVTLKPVDGAAVLEALLRHYWHGLMQPLDFYPESAWAFAEAVGRDKDGREAAERTWAGYDGRGEGQESAYYFHPGEGEPFTDDFRALALAILGPLLAAREGGV